MAFHEGVRAWHAALPGWAQTAVTVALVVVVGYVAIHALKALLLRAARRRGPLDPTLRTFLHRLVVASGYVVLGVVVLRVLGVDLTALLGGLAIGGFVVGFALKDSLGNLAAGLTLLAYRPFDNGDFVTIAGNTGKVVELGVALTTMEMPDGRMVTLPNGAVLGGAIVNFTRNPIRRADVKVGIAYDDDVDAAVRAILGALAEDPLVLQEPAPAAVVTALADSAVEIEVRAWARNADFGAVINGLRPLVKRALADAGCTIPFPQREVHVRQHPASGVS